MVNVLPRAVGACHHEVHRAKVEQRRGYGVVIEVRVLDDCNLVGKDVGADVLDALGHDVAAVIGKEILVVG